MAQAYAVLNHGRFIWILQTNVLVVLLDPGFNGTASLPNAVALRLVQMKSVLTLFWEEVMPLKPATMGAEAGMPLIRLDEGSAQASAVTTEPPQP
jgi:hypothetical protein